MTRFIIVSLLLLCGCCPGIWIVLPHEKENKEVPPHWHVPNEDHLEDDLEYHEYEWPTVTERRQYAN